VLAAWKAANRVAAVKVAFKPVAHFFGKTPQRDLSAPELLREASLAGGELAHAAETVARARGIEVWRLERELRLKFMALNLLVSASGKTIAVIDYDRFAILQYDDFTELQAGRATPPVFDAFLDDTRLRALCGKELVEITIGNKKRKKLAEINVAAQTRACVTADSAAWIEVRDYDYHDLVVLQTGATSPIRIPIEGTAKFVKTINGRHHVVGTTGSAGTGPEFHIPEGTPKTGQRGTHQNRPMVSGGR
jgi:hypothetical protein